MKLITLKNKNNTITNLSNDEFKNYLDTLESTEQFQHVLEELYSIRDMYKEKEERSRLLKFSSSIACYGFHDPDLSNIDIIPLGYGFLIGLCLAHYNTFPHILGGVIGAASTYGLIKSLEKFSKYKCKKHIEKKHDVFVKMKLTNDKIVELNNNSTNHNSIQYNYEKE